MQRTNIAKRFYQALAARRPFRDCNTVITKDGDTLVVYLHGNLIAHLVDGKSLYVTFAGWNTPTTCKRLHTILQVFAPHWRANIIKGVGTFSCGRFFQAGDLTIGIQDKVAA